MTEAHTRKDRLIVTPGERQSVSFGGETASFLVSGEDSGGSVGIVEQTLGPRILYGPLHLHHQEDGFLYILEGDLDVQRGEQIAHATAESLVFLPKGIAHTFWNPGARSARFLEIFSPAGLERYFNEVVRLLADQAGVGAFIECAEKYGLQMLMESVPELMRKHGVKLLGT